MRTITTYAAPATGLRGVSDTSWHTRAVCHGMDPEDADETFFPLPRDRDAIAEAKALCALCPVRRDCLNFAVENGQKEGIWGGLTEAERRPWHDGLPHRLDYQRVRSVFLGRDVHLTAKERDLVVDHAYARGWQADRLAITLRISHEHARDLLAEAAHKVFDRDLTLGVPPNPYKNKKKTKKRQPQLPHPAPSSAQRPLAPGTSGGIPTQRTGRRGTFERAA